MPDMFAGWKPRGPRESLTIDTFGGQIRLRTDFIQSISCVIYRVVREPTGTKIDFCIQIGAYRGDEEIAWLERGVLYTFTFLWDEKFLKMEPGGFSGSLVPKY
jgi:hypothetical protein